MEWIGLIVVINLVIGGTNGNLIVNFPSANISHAPSPTSNTIDHRVESCPAEETFTMDDARLQNVNSKFTKHERQSQSNYLISSGTI